MYLTINGTVPNAVKYIGFHCEICEWESGDENAYDQLVAHVHATNHLFHNRGPKTT